MLAWITSENSTKQLECRHFDSIFFTGPYLMLLRLSARVSTVDRLCLCPVANSLSSFVQPTLFLHPVTTSGPAENSSPKPFVWFRAKTDKGVVCLAGHLHCVTVRKVKLTVFWDMKGSLTINFFKKDATVNSASYCQLLR